MEQLKFIFNKHKKFLPFVFLSFLCCPIFFINIKTSHDWGDDFAQYIHQAKNIVEHVLQDQTGYIYNAEYPLLGPCVYPIGLPILLAPVYAIWGNSMLAFNYQITFFLFALLLASYVFFKKHFSNFIAILLVLIMAYNPWLLQFKTEILSDIPFTFFTLLLIILYQQQRKNSINIVCIALLCGLVISIRTIGISLLAAIFIHQIFCFFYNKNTFSKHTLFIILVVCIAFYFALNCLVYKLPSGFMQQAATHFSLQKIFNTTTYNLYYYTYTLQSFFYTPYQPIQFISNIISTGFLCLSIIGFCIKIKKNFGLTETFFLVYFITIIVYPYSFAGFRFLLPVLPILLLFSATAFKSILLKIVETRKVKTIAILCVICFFLLYINDVFNIKRNEKNIVEGPMQLESIEAINYIKQNTPSSAFFLFIKPRALSLYTGRACFSANPQASIKTIGQQIAEYKLNYILYNKNISGGAISKFIDSNSNTLQLIWQNNLYKLYKTN